MSTLSGFVAWKGSRGSSLLRPVEIWPKQSQEKQAFAETGHAMRLLEAAAAAVAQSEPLLLAGETGTGKTALVQHLATQVLE